MIYYDEKEIGYTDYHYFFEQYNQYMEVNVIYTAMQLYDRIIQCKMYFSQLSPFASRLLSQWKHFEFQITSNGEQLMRMAVQAEWIHIY